MPDCTRCGSPIETPVEQHANYIMADDTVATDTVEVVEAVVHTTETKAALEDLQANHYPERSLDTLEQAVVSDTDLISYLNTPPENDSNDPPAREQNAKAAAPAVADFDRVEIPDVADAPPDTAKVERRITQRDVQKTGLVHRDEVKDSDTVIW